MTEDVSPSGSQAATKQRTLIVIAALGVVAYTAAAITADAAKLREALIQLGWLGSAMVLTLSLANYGLRFERWKRYLAYLGRHPPVLSNFLSYVSGFAFTVSPAKAGEAVRFVYLRRYGVTFSENVATLFVERLLDLLAIVVLSTLIVFSNPTYQPLLIGVSGAALTLVIVICQPFPLRWLDALAARSHGPRIKKSLSAAANLLRSSQRLLHPRFLLFGLLLGVASWGAEGIGFHLICRVLQFDIPLADAVGIYALSALAGTAAIFLPAGIGGMEFVMTSLLVSRGAPLSSALIATLLCRLATLWFAVIIGLGAAAILEFKQATQQRPSTP